MGLFRQDELTTTLLQGVTQALSDSKSNETRQNRHEDECSERYREITHAIDRLSGRMMALVLSVAGSIIIALAVFLYNLLRSDGKL